MLFEGFLLTVSFAVNRIPRLKRAHGGNTRISKVFRLFPTGTQMDLAHPLFAVCWAVEPSKSALISPHEGYGRWNHVQQTGTRFLTKVSDLFPSVQFLQDNGSCADPPHDHNAGLWSRIGVTHGTLQKGTNIWNMGMLVAKLEISSLILIFNHIFSGFSGFHKNIFKLFRFFLVFS